MRTIAIIIPAYKTDYLVQTLESLANQKVKDFCVYIGDDASPYDIKSIADEYSERMDIVYHRFDMNIGGSSLIKQWERCIELSKEEWIWLFSDDDIADENCVGAFIEAKNENSKFYKFNTKIIDANGKFMMKRYDDRNFLTNEITSEDFIIKRLNVENFRSFAVEYVFHRSLYNKNGFIDFPLAWASDDATWFTYSIQNKGKISILDAIVHWRHSGKNISSSIKNDIINKNKIDASIQYLNWLQKYTEEKKIKILDTKKLKWLTIQIASLQQKISLEEFKNMVKELCLNISDLEIFKSFLIIKYYQLRNKLN